MICRHCGATVQDNCTFCTNCGKSVLSAPVPNEQTSSQQPDPQTSQAQHSCKVCGALLPAQSRFCNACGSSADPSQGPAIQILPPEPVRPASAAQPPQEPPQQVSTPKQKRKKKVLLPILLSCVAMILVAAIVAGALTNWFGLYGPGSKIALATKRTLSSESYTVTLSASVGSYDSDPATIKVALDEKNKDLTMAFYSEDGDLTMAIYDGYIIQQDYRGRWDAEDIRPKLNGFFESLNGGRNPDWEKLFETIDEDLYEEMDDTIYFDKIDGSLFKILNKFNDPTWLDETAGLTISRTDGGTEYSFKPNTYDVLSTTLGCMEDIFRDKDDYEDAEDGLSDSKSELQELDLRVDLLIKSGKLLNCQIFTEVDEREVTLEADISDIGRTHIDTDELAEVLDQCKIG